MTASGGAAIGWPDAAHGVGFADASYRCGRRRGAASVGIVRGDAARFRRSIGVGVLVFAAAIAVAANHAAGNRTAGHPVADWPQPPPVGSCLDVQGAVPRDVPCENPHDAEVIKTFDVVDLAAAADPLRAIPDSCGEPAVALMRSSAGSDQVSPGRPEWRLPGFAFAVQLLLAPPDLRIGRYGWAVCAITPGPQVRYMGTIIGSAVGDRPPAYGTCYDSHGRPASCTVPHAVEVLAVVQHQVTVDGAAPRSTSPLSSPISEADIAAAQAAIHARDAVTQKLASTLPTWTEQCREVAAARTGASDPTYGGSVLVGVPPDVAAPPTLAAAVVSAPDGGTFTMSGSCVVEAPEGQLLADSMIGWGNKAPPLTANP